MPLAALGVGLVLRGHVSPKVKAVVEDVEHLMAAYTQPPAPADPVVPDPAPAPAIPLVATMPPATTAAAAPVTQTVRVNDPLTPTLMPTSVTETPPPPLIGRPPATP